MTDRDDPRLDALYRRASTEAPPPALDRRVLTAARRATRHPLAAFVPFGGHWPLGLAAAAVVVASASLVVYLGDPGGRYVVEDAVSPRREAAPMPLLEVAPEAEVPAPLESRRAPSSAPPPGDNRARSAADSATVAPEPAAKGALERDEAPPARLLPLPAVETEGEAAAPEAALRRITALLDAGRRAEARRLLAAFVQRHPDYSLPGRLEALLSADP